MANDIPASAVGNFNAGGDDWPKASIGNYKGVMLCNRPNEFGNARKADRSGNLPFNSRVNPTTIQPVGWNPCQKLVAKAEKKTGGKNNVLQKHRNYLNKLEAQKNQAREAERQQAYESEYKTQKFKDQTQKQRDTIRLTETEVPEAQPEAPVVSQKPDKLTADALSQMSEKPSQKSSAKGGKKGAAKPAWATTEKQQNEQKEEEVDDLIEFAFDLDYEKYMEDYEVRQALAIIKERVEEMRQDKDWKKNIADEWNEAAKQEEAEKRQQDQVSVYSYKSAASGASQASKASFKSRVTAEKKRQQDEVSEWDKSMTSEKRKQQSAEDRVANRIASEVLKDNAKLRGVHSGASIKKILEKEAKKQLLKEEQE